MQPHAPYLVMYPPVRSQFRRGRRKDPSGVTVLHTAESVTDLAGPDTGAESVARFIRDRTTPGSYHDLVDRDSALQLVPYSAEAYQDGTGTNPHAMSISWAISCADWPTLERSHVVDLMRQGAVAFARQQAWLQANGWPTTPLRRISREQSDRGVPGFITHGERDPGRRSDPGGRPDRFPWALWFEACSAALGNRPPALPITGDDMRVVYVNNGAAALLAGTGRLYLLQPGEHAAYRSAGVPVEEVTQFEMDMLNLVSERIRATP